MARKRQVFNRAERQTWDHEIKEHMMAIHFAHPYFRYPRAMRALCEAGYRVNHKKVCRLMKELLSSPSFARNESVQILRLPLCILTD